MVEIIKVPYESIEVKTSTDELQTISEGDRIRFITENGELKKGNITKLKGAKPEKVEIEFIPSDGKHKETWSVVEMQEGSLRLIEDDEGDNEDEEQNLVSLIVNY